MKIEQAKTKTLSLITYSIVTETMKSVTKFKPIEIEPGKVGKCRIQ